MKKQIIHPKFIPRIFALILDLFILSIVVTPILNFCRSHLLFFLLYDDCIKNQIEFSDNIAIKILFRLPEFVQEGLLTNLFIYIILMNLINVIILGGYFIGFWIYKGATPGKIMTHMKIVDAVTFTQPTNWQLIKRFCGYIILFIILIIGSLFTTTWFIKMGINAILIISVMFLSIVLIFFSKQRQPLPDKIAGTIVIKS